MFCSSTQIEHCHILFLWRIWKGFPEVFGQANSQNTLEGLVLLMI